jgi:hypothetical protein
MNVRVGVYSLPTYYHIFTHYSFTLYNTIYIALNSIYMYNVKRFHIQLTKDSEWTIELGHSIGHVMQTLVLDYSATPYSYFITEY